MQQVQGVIDGIRTQSVNTKYGDKDVYHAMINGQEVNLGFKCPYVVGESVTLDVEHKYGQLQAILPPTGAPAANGAGAPAAQVQAVPAQQNQKATVPTEFPVAKNTRGITIARQNSGGHAAQIVAALINQGKLTTVEEAKEAFMDIVYDITDFATGHREAAQAEAIQAYEEQE